jgi:hypothetical protein
MTASSEVFVTLSVNLLSRLRTRAGDLEVSLDWLVAGLVCDTIELLAGGRLTRPAPNSTVRSLLGAGPHLNSGPSPGPVTGPAAY